MITLKYQILDKCYQALIVSHGEKWVGVVLKGQRVQRLVWR